MPCSLVDIPGALFHIFAVYICDCKCRPNQIKSTCYARSSQIRAIRKKMVSIMAAEASKCQLRDLVKKFIPESIGKSIEAACRSIFPLQNVLIRKVKVIKKPKFDRKCSYFIHFIYSVHPPAGYLQTRLCRSRGV